MISKRFGHNSFLGQKNIDGYLFVEHNSEGIKLIITRKS